MWLLLLAPLALAAPDSSTSSLRVTITTRTHSNVASLISSTFPSSSRSPLVSPVPPSPRPVSQLLSSPQAVSSSQAAASPRAVTSPRVGSLSPSPKSPASLNSPPPLKSRPPLRASPLTRAPPPPPVAAMMLPPLDKDRPPPGHTRNFNINKQLIKDIKNELKRDNDDYREKLERRSLPRVTRRGGTPRGGVGAPALAALLPPTDEREVLLQPVPGTPRRRPPHATASTSPHRPSLPVGRALLWPRPDRLRPLRPPPRPPAPPRPLTLRPVKQQFTPRREMMNENAWIHPQHQSFKRTNDLSLIKNQKHEKMKRLVNFIKTNKDLLRQLIEVKREREVRGLRGETRQPPPPRRPNLRADDGIRPELLDLAAARGFQVAGMRIKGRICQRSILNSEGPKYSAKGKIYRPEFVPKNGRLFDMTKAPNLVLPVCCNCCKKSVLGCE